MLLKESHRKSRSSQYSHFTIVATSYWQPNFNRVINLLAEIEAAERESCRQFGSRGSKLLTSHHQKTHVSSAFQSNLLSHQNAKRRRFSPSQPPENATVREMANQGAKKRKEENIRHMARIRRIIIACNVIYVVIRMLIFHSSFTWKHWVGLVVTSLAYYFPYQQLAKMANPSYADDGELLDGGFDMTTGGVCGYLHDVIYITSFVQVASIISGKFWYIYLVIPAFGAYQSFGLIKGFLPQGGSEEVEDEKTRKKREKMEKKASRPKFVKTRTK